MVNTIQETVVSKFSIFYFNFQDMNYFLQRETFLSKKIVDKLFSCLTPAKKSKLHTVDFP